MPSFEEARGIILAHVAPLGEENVPLSDALGRVVSRDVIAPWDLPQYDNSAMDGYAVHAADCTSVPTRLIITGFVPAGGEQCPAVTVGCAVRIMTGAPIPPGCNAVVPIEETEQEDDQVVINQKVLPRQHVRVRGSDVASGTQFLPAGSQVRPAEVGMLAAMGQALVPVYRKARVAILSTGDELIELGESPAAGKVINSNALSLAAAVREAGAEPVLIGIARDNVESHRDKMREGLCCDALITSAGVSAGDRDLVREVAASLGAEEQFWKIGMKPGGPTAFSVWQGKPIFSLPGNPVSTMVTFELLVKPALLKMMGHKRVLPPFVKGILAEDAHKKPGKLHFIRVTVKKRHGRHVAYCAGEQHTAILSTMTRCDALAALPCDATFIPAGSEVDLALMREVDLLSEGEVGIRCCS
ncbi:molybdopterin molybdotransferase MoeA [Geomonas subterranea]|uniref:Molybdopterin molybdenumtransferase n=1 Tax=Geomonas subterranea TaxID=2847989 RepID=A0ABX8LGT5_9BACT|nr:gephyrin-like molybdotransferase Glp [Geomonas subterranea]QXE91177.1 molybdopterin molybdotransferase MoeA [Geomonas subterranea]QXM10736.1 molybdopterin molybdotransferase MoeA [Geomonas subterranea]